MHASDCRCLVMSKQCIVTQCPPLGIKMVKSLYLSDQLYLFILLLDLRLHLLKLLLALIWTHPQPLSQHSHTKDGKQSGGHVVCVDSGNDGGGIAKQYCRGGGDYFLVIHMKGIEK